MMMASRRSYASQGQVVREYERYMLGLYKKPGIVFAHGEGCVLVDTGGRRYLDFTAGIAVTALGHAHPAVTAAIREQAPRLLHTSNLFHTHPPGLLCRSLVQLSRSRVDHTADANAHDNDNANDNTTDNTTDNSTDANEHGGFDAAKVFLCNSGTEANEAAIKFARKYGVTRHASTDKHKIVSFKGGFHGRTIGALSATPNEKYQKPFQPLLSGFRYARFNNIQSVHNVIDEDTCAVMVEPVQGEGGIQPATREFLSQLRSLCDEYGALLIFDEVQCGLGRTGTFWAHSQFGVYPDMLTLAKPLANGIPIGAVICNNEVARYMEPGDHGSTFGGSPLGCHVAQTVISHIQSPSFLSHVRDTGTYLKSCLDKLHQKHSDVVVEVRGMGLMMGMELKTDPGEKLIAWLRDNGLLVCTAGRNTIRFVPPLIVTKSEIDQAMTILDEGLSEVFKVVSFE